MTKPSSPEGTDRSWTFHVGGFDLGAAEFFHRCFVVAHTLLGATPVTHACCFDPPACSTTAL
jgi:hypothetical protein